MMSPPNTMSSTFDAALDATPRPRVLSRNPTIMLSAIGSMTMKALPRKAPSTVPTPPMTPGWSLLCSTSTTPSSGASTSTPSSIDNRGLPGSNTVPSIQRSPSLVLSLIDIMFV